MGDLQDILDDYDFEASGEMLATSLRPHYEQLLELGSSDARQELEAVGVPTYNLRREELDDTIDLLAKQVADVSYTTREKIQDIVSDQGREGWSIPETAKKIAEIGEIDSRSRGRTIARTETAMAYNMATILTYTKSGVEKVVVMDGDQDADCKEADGQVWTIEQAVASPIAHPNCQRAFRPYIEEVVQPTADQGQPPVQDPLSLEPPEQGPQGTPVSQGMDLPKAGKLAKPIRAAQEAIDRVHGDGVLPALPIGTSSGTTTHGKYTHFLSGRPDSIKISTKSNHPHMTYVHEVGHFLDHHGLNTPNAPAGYFATSRDKQLMSAFQQAANQSQAISSMRALHNSSSSTVPVVGADGQTYTYRVDRQYLGYLNSDIEVWARAYAQYVAVRSGSAAMLAELRQSQAELGPYRQQWDDKDFEPIGKAIDDLMSTMGWRGPTGGQAP